MRKLRGFGRFWYDFIVGDDWRLALIVAVALGATVVVNQLTDATVWWIRDCVVDRGRSCCRSAPHEHLPCDTKQLVRSLEISMDGFVCTAGG